MGKPVNGNKDFEEMSNQPLVSVLMPSYNAELFIAKAIESIIKQTYDKWELLILDDASTDNTKRVIESFSDDRIKFYEHKKNQGYLISCNSLFEKSEGDFITFLDADDTCAHTRLAVCVEEFQSNYNLSFVTSGYAKMESSGKIIFIHLHPIDYSQYATNPNYLPTICGATLIFRKAFLKNIAGYRTVFDRIGGEDYFLIWELSKVGTGKHLESTLYNYRTHKTQLSKDLKNPLRLFMSEILFRFREAFKNRPFAPEKARAIIEEMSLHIQQEPILIQFKLIERLINEARFGLAFNTWVKTLNHPWSRYKGKRVKAIYTILRRKLSH